MNNKQLLFRTLSSAVFAAVTFFNTAEVSAQVKIGSNPTVINAANNLEVESADPTKKVSVDKTTGKVTIADGSQGAAKVLTSDANGVATWQIPATQTTQSIVSANNGPITAVQQINLGAQYLTFGVEVIDRNNDYDPTTSIFTVPSNGIYLISSYVRISGQPGYQLGRIGFASIAEIAGGAPSSIVLNSGIALENDWGNGSGSATVLLTAGQTVRISFSVSPGGTGNYQRMLDLKRFEVTKISN